MAEFDSMNMSTNVPSASESSGYDLLDVTYNYKTEGMLGGIASTPVTETGMTGGSADWKTYVGLVASVIGAIAALLAIYAFIKQRCGQQEGGDRPRAEEGTPLNPLNAYTENDGPPRQEPTSLQYVNEGTFLGSVQEKLRKMYRTLFIPKRPANPSRSIAEVDELYTELQLLEAIGKSSSKEFATRDKKICVEIPHKIPLHSWRDLLNPDKVKNLMIILSGGAGLGKSTLFKKIAHTWSTSNQLANFKLVFLIELKKMKSSSIIDAILDQCFQRDEQPDRDDFIRTINANQQESVLLLDGLDELQPRFLEPSEDVYCVDNVLRKQVLQQCRVLVATRPHKVQDIIEGYPRSLCVETSGFKWENTEEYIRKYFKDEEEKGDELIQIMNKGSLRQLTHFPIICQIVCHLFKFGKSQLANKLTELYGKFTEFLARRRCGEDWKQRLETALRVLGHVAFDALLDNRQLVLTQQEFDNCASVLNDASGESGFIQQETYESVDQPMVIITFIHKTFQEYAAAFYFVNLYGEECSNGKFRTLLEQINPDNVLAMGNLLRFACGISSGSPATGLILEHVQKQDNKERFLHRRDLQKLARLLLFESDSERLADELDRPTEADCKGQEELLAMSYYLEHLSQPLVEFFAFAFYCRSQEELMLLRDINDRLRDNSPHCLLDITCESSEELTLFREMVLSRNIRPDTARVSLMYSMSERGNEGIHIIEETLEGMDEGLRFEMRLTVEINEMSHFDDDDCELGSASHVCNQINKVRLQKRTCEDVVRLGNALGGCDRLEDVVVEDTQLHGHLADLDSLVHPDLQHLTLRSCGLDDDDIPDLICILPAGHGLVVLHADGNAFSKDGLETLTAHLRKLPELWFFVLQYTGFDAESVKQMVKQNLPQVVFL